MSAHEAFDDEAIEDRAALWIAQRDEGMSAAEQQEFNAWRHADPRHAAAVARIEETCAILQKMPFAADRLALATKSSSPPRTAGRGPRIVRMAGAIAAALLIAAIAWWQWPAPVAPALRYATSAGGYERVTLADGSVLELNADSVARVQFAAGRRRVTLDAGEAHFSVAPDPARPFIVTAGEVSVRAIGTAFNVRLATAAVEVLVTEGKVQVGKIETPALAAAPSRDAREKRDRLPASDGPTLVQANERVVVPTARTADDASILRAETVAPAVMQRALSWQERKLVFSDTPLGEVVERFNRRNRIQLALGDASLADRAVGGTFAADNVEVFVRLLESTGDVVAERRGERGIILRKAP